MKKMICALSLATAMLFNAGCDKKRSLYVYTWADYVDPELLEKFEADNNCKVVIDTFDSNESLFAKLMAGGTGYDIIVPTEYIIKLLAEADLIDKVDMNQLPNVAKNFDPRFKNEFSLVYGVPYAFSCTGIMWRKDKVPADIDFNDWNAMFDSRLGNRVCIMDDIRELLGLALKMHGHSVNSTNEVEIEEAAVLAREWKNRCTKMDNEAYRTGIPSGNFYAAMSYNSDAIMLVADDPEHIGYVVPTNGTASSVDVLCIMKSSPSKDLAHKFIDMFYVPENAVKNAEYNGAPMPVKDLYNMLSDKYKAIPYMQVTDDLLKRCENLKDVGKSIDLYTKAWDKVKAQ